MLSFFIFFIFFIFLLFVILLRTDLVFYQTFPPRPFKTKDPLC